MPKISTELRQLFCVALILNMLAACSESDLVKIEKNKSRVVTGIRSVNKYLTGEFVLNKVNVNTFFKINTNLQRALAATEKISTKNLSVDANGKLLKDGFPFDPTKEIFNILDEILKDVRLIEDGSVRDRMILILNSVESSLTTIKLLVAKMEGNQDGAKWAGGETFKNSRNHG